MMHNANELLSRIFRPKEKIENKITKDLVVYALNFETKRYRDRRPNGKKNNSRFIAGIRFEKRSEVTETFPRRSLTLFYFWRVCREKI
jgi:hypothetical protein